MTDSRIIYGHEISHTQAEHWRATKPRTRVWKGPWPYPFEWLWTCTCSPRDHNLGYEVTQSWAFQAAYHHALTAHYPELLAAPRRDTT